MLYQGLKTDFTFTDDRGTLTQLARTGYSQINVVGHSQGGNLARRLLSQVVDRSILCDKRSREHYFETREPRGESCF